MRVCEIRTSGSASHLIRGFSVSHWIQEFAPESRLPGSVEPSTQTVNIPESEVEYEVCWTRYRPPTSMPRSSETDRDHRIADRAGVNHGSLSGPLIVWVPEPLWRLLRTGELSGFVALLWRRQLIRGGRVAGMSHLTTRKSVRKCPCFTQTGTVSPAGQRIPPSPLFLRCLPQVLQQTSLAEGTFVCPSN